MSTFTSLVISTWRAANSVAGETMTIGQPRAVAYDPETGLNAVTTANSTGVTGMTYPPNSQALMSGSRQFAEGVAVELADMMIQVAVDDLPSDLRPGDTVSVEGGTYEVVAVSLYADEVFEASLRAVR